MIDVHVIAAVLDGQCSVAKEVKFDPRVSHGEIVAVVFELERIKHELILKSYEIKPPFAKYGDSKPPEKPP